MLSVAIFFRDFLNSDFNSIAGDLGDNRFIITILEHWRAVAHNRAFFTAPDFFWPQQDVLGYSESLFLLALPYMAARGFGMDPYIAFELTLILFKTVGFFSMLWLLRSFVNVSRSVALVGSSLFTLSNLYFISSGHGQLMTVAFIPLLAALACTAWYAHDRRQRILGYLCAALVGLLLALLLFSSYYIGWFTVLAGGVVILGAALHEILHQRALLPVRQWIRSIADRRPTLATAAFAFLIGIAPFLVTYVPTLKQTRGRTFQECLVYSAEPIDVVNVGASNWIWGRTLDAIRVRSGYAPMMPAEAQRGWPPFTLGLLVAGLLLGSTARTSRSAVDGAQTRPRLLARVLGLSFVVCWLLSIKVHERSLWWVVFNAVPGASGIRVPPRFNLVLNVLVVIVACLVLNELHRRKGHAAKFLFWALSFFLLAEQINTAATHLIPRHSEMAMLDRVHRPPSTCASFYLAHSSSPERPPYAKQIDAMLIARLDNLPTVNGYSGWTPPGWDLATLDKGYLARVGQWARSKGVVAGICGLDLRDGSWIVGIPGRTTYLPGFPLDFHRGGDASQYEIEGWGEAENGGTWALGKHSVLELLLRTAPSADLFLTLRAHAFTPPQRPSFEETLQVNHKTLAHWDITDQQSTIEEHVRLPVDLIRSRSLRIDLFNSDPTSPAELGVSVDDRKLGLAVESIELDPSQISPPALNH